jgi:hypothetical protein
MHPCIQLSPSPFLPSLFLAFLLEVPRISPTHHAFYLPPWNRIPPMHQLIGMHCHSELQVRNIDAPDIDPPLGPAFSTSANHQQHVVGGVRQRLSVRVIHASRSVVGSIRPLICWFPLCSLRPVISMAHACNYKMQDYALKREPHACLASNGHCTIDLAYRG